MTTNLIWILYRSDSDTAYKETLNCKRIIESYGKKVLFSEISNETKNMSLLVTPLFLIKLIAAIEELPVANIGSRIMTFLFFGFGNLNKYSTGSYVCSSL